jgi:hypothetical protein
MKLNRLNYRQAAFGAPQLEVNAPIHERHMMYELSDDKSIKFRDTTFEDGDVVLITTETYPNTPEMGKVERRVIEGSRQQQYDRRIAAFGLSMNEATWNRFTNHLKKKCSGGGRPILHVMGVAKSIQAIKERIALSVEPSIEIDVGAAGLDVPERTTATASVVEPSAEALQAALYAESDGSLNLEQVSEVLTGLDDNSARTWRATDAGYEPDQEALGATTHVFHAYSVKIMRSEDGLETIEFTQVPEPEMCYYGLTYNDENGSIHRKTTLSSVLERFQNTDRMYVNVYDTASKTKMCNHTRVAKIRKCKNGNYRLYLEKNRRFVSTTMTGKSKQARVMLYNYNRKLQAPPGQMAHPEEFSAGDAFVEPDRKWGYGSVMKILPENWVEGKGNLQISLEGNVGDAFKTKSVYWLSNGDKHRLTTVKSVEYDGSKTMVTMDRPLSMSGGQVDALTIKPIPMAMSAKPLALKLTLTAAASVEDQEPEPAIDIADAINEAIWESDKGIELPDIDDVLAESGQDIVVERYGVTGVDVFNRFPELAQTKSSVAREIGVTISSSSNGKITLIDIDQGFQKSLGRVHVYKSALNDSGVKDEETGDESFGLQLEHIRRSLALGQDGKELGQERVYGAHVTILGADGVVKCDRESVSKVLRKKKGGKCIYRLVVDHGKKVKTTHPGKHDRCVMFIDDAWVGRWE